MSMRARFLLSLGISLATFSVPSAAQSLGSGYSGDGYDTRTYMLSVIGIANSRMDLSGAVSSIPVSGPHADLQGWSVEASALGQRLSWVGGYGERTLQESVDFKEIYGGAMLNFRTSGTWIPYLIGTVRYSQDLNFPTMPSTTSADFFGWSGGIGVRHHSTDRFFLDVRLSYEGVFEDIDAGMSRNLNMQGLLAMVGAGFTF